MSGPIADVYINYQALFLNSGETYDFIVLVSQISTS